MSLSLRRPLMAGALLLVLALALSACAANGAAAPSTATPAVSTLGTSAPGASQPSPAPATTESTSLPAASTAPSETPATEPAATAAGTQAAATSTPALGSNGSPVGTGTPSNGGVTTAAGGISEVTYTAVDYSYQGPDQLPAGWTRFTLDNRGKSRHDLMLYKIEAGKTLQDVTQALSAGGPPDWAQSYGSTSANAGTTGSYLVDLAPGNYVMLSFGDNPQGPPDAAQGMVKMLTVTGTPPAAASVQLPQPDATINMVDYHFQVTGTLKSGSQTILLTNGGTEMHEAQVLQLKPGTTLEQFQKLLMQANGSQESQIPATPIWGMVLSPKVSAYSTATLTAGDYVIVCFIPSPKNGGKPHYALGMISPFTVK